MVRRYYDGQDIVDVGIGGGRFITECGAFGFDINPEAVAWLKQIGRFRDPAGKALTFWDSLEHQRRPSRLPMNGFLSPCRSTETPPTFSPPSTTSRASTCGIGRAMD